MSASQNTITFTIVTPDGVVYDDDQVAQVSIPTTTGEVTILPHHIPLISVLASGELRVKKVDGHEVAMAVGSGLLEVMTWNKVRILADTAERAEHVSLERAEEARVRAEQLLREVKAGDDVMFARLQAKIEKELARAGVARKYRKIKV